MKQAEWERIRAQAQREADLRNQPAGWFGRNAIYFASGLQTLGGVLEIAIGGVAATVPGLQLPALVLMGLGVDTAETGIRSFGSGEQRDTRLSQAIGKVAEQFGATEYEGLAYARAIDGAVHLGFNIGVSAGLRLARTASRTAGNTSPEGGNPPPGLPKKIAEGYGLAAEEAAAEGFAPNVAPGVSHNAARAAALADDLRTGELANPVTESLRTTGQLPSNYVTKAQATAAGWEPGKALNNTVPGGQIGGDILRDPASIGLPKAPGRVWYEADIGLSNTMSRAKQPGTRLLYSNDGKAYVTPDHYGRLYQLPDWK